MAKAAELFPNNSYAVLKPACFPLYHSLFIAAWCLLNFQFSVRPQEVERGGSRTAEWRPFFFLHFSFVCRFDALFTPCPREPCRAPFEETHAASMNFFKKLPQTTPSELFELLVRGLMSGQAGAAVRRSDSRSVGKEADPLMGEPVNISSSSFSSDLHRRSFR